MKKEHAKKCPRYLKKRFKGGCTFCDGYHTFDELYEHRISLYIQLCKQIYLQPYSNTKKYDIWRSKKHHDGTMFDGMFIMGIGTGKGKQITYHLPLKKWMETRFAKTLDFAPKFDNHTSDDVLKRLNTL